MRRFVSGLCLALMFVAVSLAQTAWWVSGTFGDTASFRDAVRRVASDPTVMAAMTDDLAGVLADGADLSTKQSGEMHAAVGDAVADPAFADTLAATLGGVHAALLAGRNPAAGLDLGAVQDQVRATLEPVDARLAAAVPREALVREIDPGRLPWVPRVMGWIGTAVPVLVVASVFLLGLAILVSRDRPRTLRRAGFVLIASVALTVLMRFVMPAVILPLLPPGVIRVFGAAVVSFMLAALVPGLVITAAVGAALAAGGILWARSRSRPAGRPVPVEVPAVAAPRAPGRVGPGPTAWPGSPASTQSAQPLPVAGPPIANPPAAGSGPAVAPVLASPARTAAFPVEAPPASTSATPTQPVAAPTAAMASPAAELPTEIDEDEPGGWGPLRY